MIIKHIIVFGIVASISLGTLVQGGISDDELTLDQLEGRWFEVGKISKCVAYVRACSTYEIDRIGDSEQELLYTFVPIDNLRNCAHGVPIYTESAFGTLVNSTLHIEGTAQYETFSSTVESYNNGTELIFFVAKNKDCDSPSYRLWSRKREVSEETKIQFEKLTEDADLEYYSWDDCPKLRSETDDEFTYKQIDGLWYDIAGICNRDFDNNACTESNITVNYENETLNMTTNSITNGTLTVAKRVGTIVGSVVQWQKVLADNNIDSEMVSSHAISCNNGTELLWRNYETPNYGLLSRYPRVPEDRIVEFRRLAKNYIMDTDLQFRIFPQDNCPNRAI